MRPLRQIATAASLLLLLAAPAAAQRFNTAAGYGGGFMHFGAFNPDADEASELALKNGWVVNLFGEGLSNGGHAGLKVNAAFTRRPLDFAGDKRNISTWMADASVVLRPMALRPDRAVSPWVSAGGGFINYGLGRKGRIVVVPGANVLYPGDDESQWTVVGGAGLDFVLGRTRLWGTPLGLRLEVADHIVPRSPFRSLDDKELGPIHNVRFGASLVGFGWF
jgi:hypothetical protein